MQFRQVTKKNLEYFKIFFGCSKEFFIFTTVN